MHVAKLMGDAPNKDTLTANGTIKNPKSALEFRFDPASHINGWWCLKIYEGSLSGQDNYLCTNRDIGLSYIVHYAQCNPNLKCVYLPEYRQPSWSDNALCLPLNSNIELMWTPCGALPSMSCVRLYDPKRPTYFRNSFVCWKEHINSEQQ